MTIITGRLAGVGIAVMALLAAGPAWAVDGPRGVVKLTGRILATPRGGVTVARAEASATLQVGESRGVGLFTRDFDGGVGSGQWPPENWAGEHAWHIEARLLSVAIDVARLEVSWRRFDGKTGLQAAVLKDTQTVSMRQGQRRILDLARAPSPDSRNTNVIVELEATYVGDPAYENVSISHDVWLIHESGGEAVRRQVGFVTRQGEERRLEFAPVEFFPLGEGARPAAGVLRLLVEGQLSTRLVADGIFETQLTAIRTLDCGGGRAGRGTGTMSLKSRDGETVAIELPAGSAYCTMPADVRPGPSMPPGLSAAEDRVRVDFGEFFRGAKTSILITARRR